MKVSLKKGGFAPGSWQLGPFVPRNTRRTAIAELDALLAGAERIGMPVAREDTVFEMDEEFLRYFHAEREPALSAWSVDFLKMLPTSEHRGIVFNVSQFVW